MSKAEAAKLRAALIGKPLVVTGKTLVGKDFATEQWKGRVVLVDFWASWCPDCKAEMPSVIQMYQTYHDQGLEIVGISSDVGAERAHGVSEGASGDFLDPALYPPTGERPTPAQHALWRGLDSHGLCHR